MTAPRFSICLLAHNSAAFLRDAIESVLAQSATDWELLIADDASTDATPDVIAPYLGDPRIRAVRHEKNLGQAGNWAFALGHTTAPIVTTLHADDVWEPFALDAFAAAFATDPAMDFAWGQWVRCTGSLQPMVHQPPPSRAPSLYADGDIFRHVLRTNCTLPSALAVRRDLLARAGLPDPAYGMLCDRDWMLRAARHARRARSLERSITRYRVHAGSITTEFVGQGRLAAELDRLRECLPAVMAGLPDAAALLARYERSLGEFYFRFAVDLRLRGQLAASAARMTQALRSSPALLLRPAFFIKWLLFHGGEPGRGLLRRVHGANQWVVQPAKTVTA